MQTTINLDRDLVTTTDHLEAIVGTPRQLSIDKVSPVLTPAMQAYIDHSPFFLLATASDDGTCDVSPRGDPAGSVNIFDERTLVLPERPGNKRVDSMRNIVNNPHIGLLFMVPGSDETLRVNGTARISANEDLLATMPVQGKLPKLAIIVTIAEAYMHCARAFRRSRLWSPDEWPDQADVPGMAAILHEQLHMEQSVEEIAAEREERYRTTLY